MIGWHWWRRLIIWASPAFHLIGPILSDRLLLVLSDEITVAPLIQSPVLVNREIFLSHFHEYQIGGSNASSQHGSMNFIKPDATVMHHLTGNSSFQNSVICQGGVSPSNEHVVPVPGALSVTEKAKCVRSILVDAWKRFGMFAFSIDGWIRLISSLTRKNCRRLWLQQRISTPL